LRECVVAEYTRREVVTRRVEFAFPNPSNAVEYAKACAAAKGELEAAGREIYDNTITITATDAEIILSYEEQHAVKAEDGTGEVRLDRTLPPDRFARRPVCMPPASG
jgi:hypothetical protein